MKDCIFYRLAPVLKHDTTSAYWQFIDEIQQIVFLDEITPL